MSGKSSQDPFKAKSSSNVLEPLSDPELAPPASRIHGRPLLPEKFRPESGRDVEVDGKPLSKFGGRFREVFAAAHGVDDADVDLGIIRQVEALNADTDRNLHALSAVQAKRTEAGTLRFVRITVNTPLIQPWLLNGRALRRMGIELGGAAKVVSTATDHPTLALPTMRVESPEAVLEIITAQRRLLGLQSYTATSNKAERRERVNSIIQFGVLEPPEVVLVELQSDAGSAWVAQAAEGAQRLFSSLIPMDQLANRNVGMLSAEHWFDGGTPALRNLTASDLERLADDLTFPSSAAAPYFPQRTKLKEWVEETAAHEPAAVAFQLLRTMDINLILAVEPDDRVASSERDPVSCTVQEMIRSYHVPGKAKDPWNDADVFGLIAIGAIDELLAENRITEFDRSVWLGESIPEWGGTNDGEPGRLVSVAQLIATLTARRAVPDSPTSSEDSLSLVGRHLPLNGKANHPVTRAKVAAAQAVAVLGQHGTGKENALQAAIYSTFNSGWFWKTDEQEGADWPPMLTVPIAELADKALAEAEAAGDSGIAGPAQRALAALGGLALIANPKLVDNDLGLSQSGRGGGGRTGTNVKASAPSAVLERMVRSQRGINQLRDAVTALTVNADTAVPTDREEAEILSDLYLRKLWLGEENEKREDNPDTEFARQIQALVNSIVQNADEAARLREVLPGEIVGRERSDEDDESVWWSEPIFDAIGINEQAAERVLPLLQQLSEFFHMGKAFAGAAARAAR